MKLIALLLLGVNLAVLTSGIAEEVGRDCSAEYYLGRADEFLNKSVMLIATDIYVPAKNAGTEDSYRIFDVVTGYRETVRGEGRSIETRYAGWIRIVIEKEKAEKLVGDLQMAHVNNTHNAIFGVFKKWDLKNHEPKNDFYVDLRE
jgi:hypothetical protein